VRARLVAGISLGAIASFAAGMVAHAVIAPPRTRVVTVEPPAKPPGHDAAVGAGPAVATAPGRVEHAVWKLVDNRHAAHRFVEEHELVLDGSTVGLAKYVRFGVPRVHWHLGRTVAGKRAAAADRVALLELPLGGEHAKAVAQVTARIHGKDKQAVALRVNGKKIPETRTKLGDGWQTISIPVPAGKLGAGENQVAIETSGADGTVAFEWLRFGAARSDAGDPREAAVFDAKADAIELARNASLTWYITVPDGGHLVGSVGGPCKVDIRAHNSDASFAAGVLAANRDRVDLTAMAGRVVALSLTTRECPRATITAPRITMIGPEPKPLPKAEPARYVVLWVMDAVRADHIPLFTPGARTRTPNLDDLAKSSAVFRQYYVQGNESQTSHSSMWTGLYPAVHNVRLAGVGGVWKIESRHGVLAKELADIGFKTVAVTGNGYVNEEGGYARGFSDFNNMMARSKTPVIFGQKIVDMALAKLDAHRHAPTYLFVGTIDNHAPWIARKPWIDVYSPPPYKGPFQEFGTAKELGMRADSMGCAIVPPPRDVERLRAIYDSAISYQDQELGRFVAQLKAWGIWDQTVLVVTADHGEELFEEKRCGHGGSLRESLLRVPLLIHDPARFPGGTIVDEGAEAVDLLPSVLESVGAPVVEAAQGAPLEPLAQGIGRGWPRPSYSSMYEYAHAMRIGRWKMRVGVTGTPIVADLASDPDERVDASRTRPVERRMLTDNLSMFLMLRRAWSKRDWGVTTAISPGGAAELDAAVTP
jgi:arylsulfatase A-like enzyme